MTAPFPHRYTSGLSWIGDSRAMISAGRTALTGGPPPEFDGSDEWWSPEHLLISAANLCLMTTFMALSRKALVEVREYRSQAEGVLDKTPEGLAFTRITLHVQVAATPADAERVQNLLESAKRHCLISNSLKRPVGVEATVQVSAPSGLESA